MMTVLRVVVVLPLLLFLTFPLFMAFTGWLDDQRRAGPFDALIVSLLPSSREPSAMSPAAREGGGS